MERSISHGNQMTRHEQQFLDLKDAPLLADSSNDTEDLHTATSSKVSPGRVSDGTPMLSKESAEMSSHDEEATTSAAAAGILNLHSHSDMPPHPAEQGHETWALIASPKSSTERLVGSEAVQHARDQTSRDGYRGSPTYTWAQRSPLGRNASNLEEHSSFGLFGHSFDTSSETDQGNREAKSGSPRFPKRIKIYHRTPGDAEVGSHHHRLHSESEETESLGHLSPIKLGGAHGHPRASPVPTNVHVRRIPESRPPPPPRAAAPPAPLSNPYYVLRMLRRSFHQCTYVLPCIKEANATVCPVHVSPYNSWLRYQERPTPFLSDQDLMVAERRVETAVCALGGSLTSHMPHPPSIFRRRLAGREPQYYYSHEGHISWETSSRPEPRPVPVAAHVIQDHGSPASLATSHGEDNDNAPSPQLPSHSSPQSSNGSVVAAADLHDTPGGKGRYKCKLCGQWKTNHVCPYTQSMQRTIGVSVQPTIHAYTAAEPGQLAPPLTDMNNFVSYEAYYHGKCLELGPEYYRAVTATQESHGSYSYPRIPLSIGERRRLSDTLFWLCQPIPSLTRQVGGVLRHGRANQEWDECVAQVLVQVLVGIYCHESDVRLDGLAHYLMGIGISC